MFAQIAVRPEQETRPSPGEWAVLAGILALAAALRFYHLGALGLQVDEGIQALAVQGWLQDGLPIVPSGAVYQRSIPFLYLQVITARVVGLNEFALRLPAAAFGVAAVAATYWFARGMFDRRVAVIAAVFIALSAWEIELSRYGRFYTAFQSTFVISFLCLYRMLTGGSRAWSIGFVAVSLVAITLHEFSIAIATCFLIPLFDRNVTATFRAKSFAGGMAFVTVWLAYRRFAGSWIESMAPPHGLELVSSNEPVTGGTKILPFLPDLALPDLSPVMDALAKPLSGIHLVILVSGLCVWQTMRRTSMREAALLLLAILFGVVHVFMLSFLALLAWFMLFGETWKDLWSPRLRPTLVALGFSLGYWTLALSSSAGDWRSVILMSFGFPNVLQYFLYWFAMGWPLFLVATTICCAAMVLRYFSSRNRAFLYLPAGIIIPAVVASLFSAYQESRYVFHLYPLMVVAFVWGIVSITDRVVGRASGSVRPVAVLAGTAIVALLATGDVGRLTVAPLGRSYGEPRDVMRSIISWPAYGCFHQDQMGAARYVRDHMRAGDRVVAIGLPHQLHVYRFYVGQLDAAVTRDENRAYQRRRQGRLLDRYTGATLVTDVDDLLTNDGSTTWLIGDTVLQSDSVTYFPESVRDDARRVAARTAFVGRDGITYVVRLP